MLFYPDLVGYRAVFRFYKKNNPKTIYFRVVVNCLLVNV